MDYFEVRNKVTNSAYHGKSPIIYSYEIKALAKV